MIKFSLVENLRKLANPIKSFFLENGLLYLVKIFYVAEVGPRFKNNKNDKNVAKLSRSDVLPAYESDMAKMPTSQEILNNRLYSKFSQNDQQRESPNLRHWEFKMAISFCYQNSNNIKMTFSGTSE